MKLRKWFKEKTNLLNELYIRLEQSDDIEILHQYRINLRKLHACSEVYGRVIDKKHSKKLSKLIKKSLKPTSALRDLDLFLIEVESIQCSPEIKNRLSAILNSTREKVFAEYIDILNSKKYKNSLDDLRLRTKERDFFIFNMQKIDKYKIITDMEKKIYGEFSKVNANTSFKELHDLRKKFKKFRYALNIYEHCFKNTTDVMQKSKKLKDIQNLFGDIQDNYARLEFIKSVKDEFSNEQFLELENYFQSKLQNARLELFI